MLDQDWDDDTDYRRAVGRTRIMVVVSLLCSFLVVGLVATALFGVGFFLDLVDALSR
ncbi:hypothetical protein ACQB60_09520 [Actinomycetota bacterium Odt1-20B]